MENIKKTLRLGIITAVLIAIIIYLAAFLYAEPISELFNKDKNELLTRIAAEGIRIYLISFLFAGINIIITTFFSSVDKLLHALSLTLLRGFIVVIPVAFMMAYLVGLTGVWISLTITELTVLVISVILLRRVQV